MSTETTNPAPVARPEPKSVKDFLALPAYRGRFDEVMGKRSAQFMASITNYVSQSRQVAECDPKSVIAAAFVAATLDLPIDKNLGFAWLVPYKGKVQFQLGSRGVTQLALRSGQYERLNAKAINKEAFGGFDKDVGEPIIHWDKVDDEKPIVGYAVAWRLTNGFTKTAYWSKEKVEKHAAKYSQAYRSRKPGQPWFDHFDAMALKTVASNELRKWGILSIEMQRAIQHDAGTQDDIDGPVKHDDGSGLFDVEANESMESALGGTPTGDAGKSEGNATSGQATEPTGPAYTEAQLKALAGEVENYCLNLSVTMDKLLEQAKTLGVTVPAKSPKKIAELPYATLQALRGWLEQKAKEATSS